MSFGLALKLKGVRLGRQSGSNTFIIICLLIAHIMLVALHELAIRKLTVDKAGLDGCLRSDEIPPRVMAH
jgi:hypothetical protein